MVHHVQQDGMYQLRNMNVDIHDRMINEKYLKRYYPPIWEVQKEVDIQR